MTEAQNQTALDIVWLCQAAASDALEADAAGITGASCAADLFTKAAAEIKRLRAAIRKHRENVWGNGPVGHPEDADLYELLS